MSVTSANAKETGQSVQANEASPATPIFCTALGPQQHVGCPAQEAQDEIQHQEPGAEQEEHAIQHGANGHEELGEARAAEKEQVLRR